MNTNEFHENIEQIHQKLESGYDYLTFTNQERQLLLTIIDSLKNTSNDEIESQSTDLPIDQENEIKKTRIDNLFFIGFVYVELSILGIHYLLSIYFYTFYHTFTGKVTFIISIFICCLLTLLCLNRLQKKYKNNLTE